MSFPSFLFLQLIFWFRNSETNNVQANVTLTIHGQFTSQMANIFNKNLSINFAQRNFKIQRTNFQIGGKYKFIPPIMLFSLSKRMTEWAYKYIYYFAWRKKTRVPIREQLNLLNLNI